MPNWCQNVAYIKHEDKAELDKIVAELNKKDEVKLFSSLVPNPSGEWDYDWSVQNWGTKWEASVYEYNMEEEHLYISFDTAWGPPIVFYDKIGELGFEVEAFYREEGMAFAGWYIDGEDNYYEYGNMTADEIEEQLPTNLDEMFSISQYQRDCEADEEWNAEEALDDIVADFNTVENTGKFKFASEDEKDWLRGLLKDELVTLTFTKKDGTERVMKCTLSENIIPQAPVSEETTKNRKISAEAQAVYDVEAEGWRSFRWDSLKQIEFSLGSAVREETEENL
jgi:hypothetical protein